ncbi:aldo/keto reductase [Pelagibacteraceae bacterium]|nr:aldo/keto reductase [Pelagibacteraceae bacterium]|tara:strand:+ start:98 stop:1078 length:981 start_codon:yes stop_codon:yes gene_type:complete
MKYRKFSNLNWNVSEIGLGCWGIGGNWDDVKDDEAMSVLKRSLEKGVNFFDTSDVYGDGRSEKFIGKFIKSTSEKIYVATKTGQRIRPYIPEGYNIKNLEKFIDRSLINLDVECIDLLQLHCPPKEICSKKELYEIMDEFVKKGKILHYGVSVFNLSEAIAAIKFPNVKSIQIVFNIFRQKPMEEFFKEAKKRNVAIIARGSLASGLLTGTIDHNTKFNTNDHRNYNFDGKSFDIGDTFSGVNFKKGLEAVEQLKKILPENFTLTDLALKWILTHEAVSVVIPGATNKVQVEANTRASDLNEISSLIPKIKSIYEELIKPDVHNRW